MYLRFKLQKPQDFGLKIISVGNLNVGGSGKTPLVSALASRYDNVAIILRGYSRESRGLYVVKDQKDILCDVSVSGDEAMIYASKLKDAIVIVSEDRIKAIQKAKAIGVKIIFLDDAYSKHFIKKFDILIDVKTSNQNCLPSGPFRERLWRGKEALILEDKKDFQRVVRLKNATSKMSLVTAIARPQRLDEFLPDVVSKNYFEDHHSFNKEELEAILKRDGSDSLLVTYKDFVKIKSFGVPLSLLDLELRLSQKLLDRVEEYITQKT